MIKGATTADGPQVRGRLPAFVVAVGALAVALQLPDVGRFPAVPVVLVCVASVSLAVAAAVLAADLQQRPNARLFGLASVLFALEWAFTWPDTPLPFLALPFGQVFSICLGVVLLRYPGVRLARRSERVVAVAAVVFTVGGRIVSELLTRPQWFAFGLAPGHGRLPPDTLWVDTEPGHTLSQTSSTIVDAGQLLIVPLFLVLIGLRLRREIRPLRVELLPVFVGLTLLGAVLVIHLIALLTVTYNPAGAPNLWIVGFVSVAVALIPVAFVVAALQRRLTRTAIAELVLRLPGLVTAAEIQDALRRTVDDDTLTIHYWLPDEHRYVDTEGHYADEQHVDGAWSVTNRSGELLAVLNARPEHRQRPELLTAAIAATALSLENTRLEAALRAQVQELAASRTRIVGAALAERRRIERDLHDGAQQQLLAIGVTLAQLDVRPDLDGAVRGLVAEAREQLRTTRENLRELARGVYPPTLGESGLAAAIRSAVVRMPLHVLVDLPPDRWGADTEVAAYFVVTEALVNCVKHAEAGNATVCGRVDGDTLVVSVTDDGRGGARFSAGGGLSGLRDRVGALGGDLRVDSPPGRGTTIGMRLPCG